MTIRKARRRLATINQKALDAQAAGKQRLKGTYLSHRDRKLIRRCVRRMLA